MFSVQTLEPIPMFNPLGVYNPLTWEEWYPSFIFWLKIKILLLRTHHLPGTQNLDHQENDTFYLYFKGKKCQEMLFLQFISIWAFQLILYTFNLLAFFSLLYFNFPLTLCFWPYHCLLLAVPPHVIRFQVSMSLLMVSLHSGVLFPHNFMYFNFSFSCLLTKISHRCQNFPHSTSPRDGCKNLSSVLSQKTHTTHQIEGKISVWRYLPCWLLLQCRDLVLFTWTAPLPSTVPGI